MSNLLSTISRRAAPALASAAARRAAPLAAAACASLRLKRGYAVGQTAEHVRHLIGRFNVMKTLIRAYGAGIGYGRRDRGRAPSSANWRRSKEDRFAARKGEISGLQPHLSEKKTKHHRMSWVWAVQNTN